MSIFIFSLFSECHDCYIEFSGDNLENPVASFEGGPKACQALCASTPGCKYFTWRNAGTCLLKTKIGNKNPNLNGLSLRQPLARSHTTIVCNLLSKWY